MLAGLPATFITPGITNGSSEPTYLPADLDGSTLPPAGAPATFVQWPGTGSYKIFHFHVDFTTPANSSLTVFANPAAAGFTQLCPLTRSCVPQSGTTSRLDAIGDRLMFRVAYRNFGTHESVVGNYTVSSGSVAGVRWFELRNVTNGPVTVNQQSTYQPDSIWRWLGSAAMDRDGNIAIAYSASSSTIFPQLRYAGRLATDPLNVLGQGEATLFAGTGSRWGDYASLTVDPVDDCTFWFTTEYYASTSQFNWRTRIGSFRFPTCGSNPTPTPTPTPILTPTPTPTPTPPPESVPNAPTNLAGEAVTANLIRLTWTDNSNNEFGFKIERCQGLNCTLFGEIAQTSPDATAFNNSGVARNTWYRYRVRAFNSAGNSAYSNVVSVMTPISNF